MIDPRKIGQFLMGEWDKTSQPLKERGIPGAQDATNQGILSMLSAPVLADMLAPVGTYDDGSVGLAWPKLAAGIGDAAVRGYEQSQTALPPINDDAAWAEKSRDFFDAASLAPIGGLGVNLAGGMVDNALGSAGGKLARGASDLPMDLASRMARAKEMGFDTDMTWYHGTRAGEFPEFSPSQSGTLGPGSYLTNSASDAGDFARFASGDNGPSVMPLMARGRMADMAEYNALLDETLPYRDAQREAVRILQEAGYSGLRSGNEVSVFDPRNIRSTSAAFDPAKSDSSNLLAANAKTGAAIPLGMEGQEQDPALVEYLKAIGLY
jgi:hypothetical protein